MENKGLIGGAVQTARGRWLNSTKLLLSPDETCDMLGVRRSTLFKMLESGEIPSLKVGRLRRIPAQQLYEWVQRQVDQQIEVQAG